MSLERAAGAFDRGSENSQVSHNDDDDDDGGGGDR
jgi:hypothetical protein